jgi:hypothetical protein
MATTFMDKLEAQAFRAGITKNTDDARKWFAKKLKTIKTVNRQALLKDDNFDVKTKPLPGRMFMYFYDPKHKKTLPYYDRFPLIFMVEKAEGGFYGLNLHYLPPKQRAIFFDKLTEYATNKKFDKSTRLRLKYQLLKSSSKLKFYKPCFKHYLTEHVKSRIVEVPASEWDAVLFLPSESFVKKSKNAVWNESKKQF